MDSVDFEKIFNEELNDLIELLKIESVYDENSVSEKMPYGENVYKAFVYMKEKAIRDGFEVTDHESQALAISTGKKGKRIDIPSHLDVVAADKEDFNIRIEDGKLFGRGTSDMKVPMYLTYLSLRLLKEKYPDMNKEIRIVLGSDEERTMDDMKYYVAKEGYPDFAFTPDGYFPVGIGEKGAIMWTLSSGYNGIISSLNGGSQCNVISPYASCVLNDDDPNKINEYLKNNKMDANVSFKDNKVFIETKGVAAHASKPSLGHNATVDLLKIIADVYDDETCKILCDIFSDSYGRGFGSFVSEDQSECLSVNLGILKIENNSLSAMVDCRYPFGFKAEDLTLKIKDKLGMNVSLDYNDEPTLCDADDPYVKILLDTYRENTNDYSKPVVSGGVSYAKVFKHCVGFGPNFPDGEAVAHQKGEYVKISDCLKMFKIYYEAIEKLILWEE
ncbi:MAG: Sapep family Mn(2+)-dependent dipeptidase [Erysipelotrichaceae bacterium]|nr:Sapep family Mn(2+)-dependent dipeptidase [Erysipelotrichaceae bacterium]